MHARADMGSHERAVMGLDSRAVSARVIKDFVTVLSKTYNYTIYYLYYIGFIKGTCLY